MSGDNNKGNVDFIVEMSNFVCNKNPELIKQALQDKEVMDAYKKLHGDDIQANDVAVANICGDIGKIKSRGK